MRHGYGSSLTCEEKFWKRINESAPITSSLSYCWNILHWNGSFTVLQFIHHITIFRLFRVYGIFLNRDKVGYIIRGKQDRNAPQTKTRLCLIVGFTDIHQAYRFAALDFNNFLKYSFVHILFVGSFTI